MTDFKTIKKEIYATPMDVRLMSVNSILKETHSDNIFIDDPRAEVALLRARGIVDLKLGRKMGSNSSLLEVTPYAGPPLVPKADEEGLGQNTGTGNLAGIVVESTAYTELWAVTFSSTTAFSVSGSFSGSQGTGTTSATFTSTNSDISIPDDVWSGTPADGDIIYIPVYKHHPSIVLVATMIATGLIFKGMNTSNLPDENPEGAQLYKDGISLLDSIVSGKGGLLGTSLTIDASDMIAPYERTLSGYDVTGYKSDEYNRFSSSSSDLNYPWWLVYY